MKIGRVIGNIVATRKDERLVGQKLLIVRVMVPDDGGVLKPLDGSEGAVVTVDLVGAGVGEIVIFCTGSTARNSVGSGQAPIDAAIVGIVDTVDTY
jgi:ethanolamine utilization protein EutN